MKKKLWVSKGAPEYIQNRRIFTLCKSTVFFGITLSLYFAGIAATGSNKNLLTIVAILGCLPTCKSAVNTIMFFRFKGCPKEVAEKLQNNYQHLYPLYDMVFTSYDKNFEIHHMAINDKVICAYTAKEKCDVTACETHLQNMLTQNGLKNITVKIFRDLSKYQNRLVQLEALAECGETAEKIRTLMLEISL